ncbi:hypothetical protein C8F01DRAFT_1116100 [Mycena amicta]|nr:hypothetical protein C8F01DRAFT_1116100 [Mycena amicta]
MLASNLWLLFVAQTVTAASLSGPLQRTRTIRVVPRDLTQIPTACLPECSPFSPFLQGATCAVTECCSVVFETGYFDCFQCVGTSVNASDYSLAQTYVDVVNTACASEGFTLPVLSLPGQNPNRTLATALPPGASAIPVFGPGLPLSTAVTPSSPQSTASAPASQSSGPATSTNSAIVIQHQGRTRMGMMAMFVATILLF